MIVFYYNDFLAKRGFASLELRLTSMTSIASSLPRILDSPAAAPPKHINLDPTSANFWCRGLAVCSAFDSFPNLPKQSMRACSHV